MALNPDNFEYDLEPSATPINEEMIFEIFDELGILMANPVDQAKFDAWKAAKTNNP